jgi:hypothetical protein
LEYLRAEVDINEAWEAIRRNINISSKEKLDFYELKNISHGLTKDAKDYLIKGKKPNYSG